MHAQDAQSRSHLVLRCFLDTSAPWVLLGLRTTPKEGLDASLAEIVYGSHLVVPAEFFLDVTPHEDISHLHKIVRKCVPVKQTYRDTRKTYIPRHLSTAMRIFVRTDSHCPPLTPPYTGPYRVIQRRPKAFLLDVCGTHDWISLDCLKVAYLQDDDPPLISFSSAGRPLVSSKGGALYSHTN